MILVYTFKDRDGVEWLDYGIDVDNDDKLVILPQDPITWHKLKYSNDAGAFYID